MMKSLHFLYHEVRPARSTYSYVTPCEEFEAHCKLYARIRKEDAPGLFQPEITFDDGNSSDALLALPALERNGLTATFFITAGWTAKRPGFMGWSQLRDLHAAGHRVGAHGMTHKLLTACSEVELRQELRGAKERLEEGLGVEVNLMSLPGGRANGRVLRACEEAGFLQVFTSSPRAEVLDRHPRTVGRVNLVAGTSVQWLEGVLRPASGALSRLQRSHQLKTAAKLVLGDRAYARLWAVANREEKAAADAEAPAS